jgi:hypothetical protein
MAETIRHDKTARQLRLLSDALDSGRLGPVKRLVNTLSPAEIGNLLESLPPGKRGIGVGAGRSRRRWRGEKQAGSNKRGQVHFSLSEPDPVGLDPVGFGFDISCGDQPKKSDTPNRLKTSRMGWK